ncbi:LysR family transcriptional regulator [Mycetocola tolaasinivorans]|uniref:LysR family transcriptional regulator n=1 Tax=Mycetocola tolaasinivorans TaxID=76635 RepID=A0A3L7ACV0_9MICO|nr:LysR family transcriptional regulator [Mycetocola tolaasinivorans]RLP77845.1 LysR family transcriptional regulator [Mycetocola tolaasinivorans]
MADLDLLATFLEVYRTGSITRAAPRLGLSQPAVSERMARLEAHLGESLLTRGARGTVPTAAGENLAARIGPSIDRLRTTLDAAGTDVSGTVRIGGASDVIASRVVGALAPLTASGVRIEFTLGLAENLLADLARGGQDLVLSAIRPAHPGVRFRPLVDEEFVLVGAPALLAELNPDELRKDPAAALARVPVVVYDAQLSILRRYWRSQFGRRPGGPIAMIVPDLRAILAAVIAGVGIAALPRYLADPALVAGTAVLVHAATENPLNTLYLAIPTERPLDPAGIAVLTRLTEQARTWESL